MDSPVVFPIDAIGADVALHAEKEGIWAIRASPSGRALRLKSYAADMALSALLAHEGFITHAREGLIRSTELAWAVYALALAWADLTTARRRAAEPAYAGPCGQPLAGSIQVLRSQRHAATGLFQCAGLPNGSTRWRDQPEDHLGIF